MNIVNPAAQSNASLRAATYYGHVEIVRLLLDLPLDCGVNPWQRMYEGEGEIKIFVDDLCAFEQACSCGHAEIARLMLEHVILQNACRIACFYRKPEIIRLFFNQAPILEHIHLIVRLSSLFDTNVHAFRGAEPAISHEAIRYASQNGHMKFVRSLQTVVRGRMSY